MAIKTNIKDYIWSYFAYLLKFGVNLIVLPLVLNKLLPAEYGLWITFSSIGTLVNLFDFGFSSTIVRNITYVWSGASSIQKNGYIIEGNTTRNDLLFVTVIKTCKYIYAFIAFLIVLITYSVGSIYIIKITKDVNVTRSLIAWVIYSANIALNMYYSYWPMILKAVGAIKESQQAITIGYLAQLIISIIGILSGGGIVALSLAGFSSGLTIRFCSKYFVNRYDNIGKIIKKYVHCITLMQIKNTFNIIWFNAKRAGISSIASVIMTQSTTIIISYFLGVEATGEYGLCFQLLSFVSSVSQIFYQTSIPQITEAIKQNNYSKEKKLFSLSFVISLIIYCLSTLSLILIGPLLIIVMNSNVSLNISIFIILSIIFFGEMIYSISASYISLSNNLPFVKSVTITSVCIVVISILGMYINPNIYILLFIRLIIEMSYLFWKWPCVALKRLNLHIYDLVKIGVLEIISMLKLLKIIKS